MPESGFLIGGRPPSSSCSSSKSPPRRFHFSSPLSQQQLNRGSETPLHSDLESLRVAEELQRRHTMEKQCNEKLNEQRMKYDQLLTELTSDLELLTNQMQGANEQNEDSKPLERTIEELEKQNDRLQKSILDYEDKFNGEMRETALESGQLKRRVSELEYQLRSKETTIEELKCSEATLDAELKLQKQICKCHYEKIENQDALSIRLQEMHQMLNEKAAETVRSGTALRWKNIELERMGKMASEEKKRLRDEIEEQMKVLSGAQQRVQELERNLENKTMEISKLNQMLKDGEEKETQLQDGFTRTKEQLSSLENQVFKWESDKKQKEEIKLEINL